MNAGTPPVLDLSDLLARGTVHFMGVGGAGMVALAEALAREGHTVSGCDLRVEGVRSHLEGLGVTVEEGHAAAHLEGVSLLVITSAVPKEHPELVGALEAGIPVMKRAELLGRWVRDSAVVAVAGTHGKTTTTALVTGILEAAGMAPSAFVGGQVAGWGGNFRPGRNETFVVEADEYDRSFLTLQPTVAIVTNMESDHLDQYGSLEGVREAFRSFVAGIEEEGCLVVCADDPEAARLLSVVPDDLRTTTYGLSAGSMIRGEAVESRGGASRFRVTEEGVSTAVVELPMAGLHNVRNALAAAAAARALGVGWPEIREGLEGFAGVARRFQTLGDVAGITVVDDYAHHPTEVKATLEAARQAFPGRRLAVVFQPHLYSRTRDFSRAFGEALAGADRIWITDVYAAREAPIAGVDGGLVARETRGAGAEEVHFHPSLETLAVRLAGELRSGEVCLTLGAGSITTLGPRLLELLREAAA